VSTNLKDARETYEKRRDYFYSLLQKQNKSVNGISNWRLLTFFAGAAVVVLLYITKNYILGGAVLIAGAFLFLWLVSKHQLTITSRDYTKALLEINTDSIKRLKGEWKTFLDTGKDFLDIDHRYSGDLDIFGEGSLFQWINTAVTYFGREKLKIALTEAPDSIKEIKRRQIAIDELAEMLEWRQRFIAQGIVSKEKMKGPHELIEWACGREDFYHKPQAKLLFKVLPVITITFIILPFFLPAFGYLPALLALVIQLFILKHRGKEREFIFKTAEKYKNNLKVYDSMLRMLETNQFQTEYLMELKNSLKSDTGKAAFEQVKELSKIIDSITNRFNIFYFVFNLLTLWDYQCIFALEGWKRESGSRLATWLEVIGEIESLSSRALIKYDNHSWAVPDFFDGASGFIARDMGHPLLSGNCVRNDLTIQKPSDVLLITGSNMSGKSTILRTVGINLVLAYAGSPVCAASFKCTLMDIYSCMRISDNLEKSISSFYEEILRIKMIVKAAQQGKKVFFLLDEIFKGTNSIDRHTGAKMLIMKLKRFGAVGLVSTHDLELGELEAESNKEIKNYHFEEYYSNNKLHFDYKLKEGMSTTRNAMYLMKLAGIDGDGED
jgi:DNA mismatch repair ATPase MutS